MNDVFVLAAVAAGISIGVVLYSRFSGGSATVIALFGLVRNLALGVSGLFFIIGGGPAGLILGIPLIAMAVFLGSSHAGTFTSDSDESWRKRLHG